MLYKHFTILFAVLMWGISLHIDLGVKNAPINKCLCGASTWAWAHIHWEDVSSGSTGSYMCYYYVLYIHCAFKSGGEYVISSCLFIAACKDVVEVLLAQFVEQLLTKKYCVYTCT